MRFQITIEQIEEPKTDGYEKKKPVYEQRVEGEEFDLAAVIKAVNKFV